MTAPLRQRTPHQPGVALVSLADMVNACGLRLVDGRVASDKLAVPTA